MPEDCAGIIDCLIERRRFKGITQKELAQAANLTRPVIARMESKKSRASARYTFKGGQGFRV